MWQYLLSSFWGFTSAGSMVQIHQWNRGRSALWSICDRGKEYYCHLDPCRTNQSTMFNAFEIGIHITDKVIVILSLSCFALAFPRLHKTFITDRGRPYTDTPCVIPLGILKSSRPIGDDPNGCMASNLTYNFVRYSCIYIYTHIYTYKYIYIYTCIFGVSWNWGTPRTNHFWMPPFLETPNIYIYIFIYIYIHTLCQRVELMTENWMIAVKQLSPKLIYPRFFQNNCSICQICVFLWKQTFCSLHRCMKVRTEYCLWQVWWYIIR